MYYIRGTELAQKGLEDLKEAIKLRKQLNPAFSPSVKVYCDDIRNPYYRGIQQDGNEVGVTVFNARDYKRREASGEICIDKSTAVDPIKDLDGGQMFGCTAEALIQLLKFWNIDVKGKDICVIGRSDNVGKAVFELLNQRNATVTLCHSYTKTLEEKLSNVDIIVSAAPNGVYFDTPENAENIVLIDIGNNFEDTDSWLARTPLRGGIGPVTRVILLYHAFYKEIERISFKEYLEQSERYEKDKKDYTKETR